MAAEDADMAQFLIKHHHEPSECAAAIAAWRGFSSPLRGRPTLASCRYGGHETWWRIRAESEERAMSQLPRFVAERAFATEVEELKVP